MKQEENQDHSSLKKNSNNCSQNSSTPYVVTKNSNENNSNDNSHINDFICKRETERFYADKFSQSSTSSLISLSSTTSDYSPIKKEKYVESSYISDLIKIESSEDDDVIILDQERAEPFGPHIIELDSIEDKNLTTNSLTDNADSKKIIEIDIECESDVFDHPGKYSKSTTSKKAVSSNGKRKPKKIWSSSDIELLLDGIELYGSKWNKVASHVGKDCKGIQCKRRWESIRRKITKND
ncbi:hypothetical protein C1645_833222 [Glomus cerebriforme]|uniref:Uncharacterized protein n=1 Tax=Glomus cerebriforme TaxID=658196 RepID=A0A397SCW6_9GLOM|nr:hypothetical protein C1645_833222 [Glomus cerebriforme]